MTGRHVGGQYNRYKDTGGKVHAVCGLPHSEHQVVGSEMICPDDPRTVRLGRVNLDPVEPSPEDDPDWFGGPVDVPEPSSGIASLFDDPEV